MLHFCPGLHFILKRSLFFSRLQLGLLSGFVRIRSRGFGFLSFFQGRSTRDERPYSQEQAYDSGAADDRQQPPGTPQLRTTESLLFRPLLCFACPPVAFLPLCPATLDHLGEQVV